MKKPSATSLIVAAVTLALGFGAGRCSYFTLYRARCGAISVKISTMHRTVTQLTHIRHRESRPLAHLLDILLGDFSDDYADGFFLPFCIEGSPKDVQVGRYTWADYKAGRVTKSELLAEAHRHAGPMPRWDRFGSHAFLMTETELPFDPNLLVSIGSVIHHHDPTYRPLQAGFADEHVVGGVSHQRLETWLQYLDDMGLPRPPGDLWEPYIDIP